MSRPVVLVSLDWQRAHDPRRSLGAASLLASLKQAAVPTVLVEDAVNRSGFDRAHLVARVAAALVDAGNRPILAIGAFVWNEVEVQNLLQVFASTHAVVLGGPQISFAGPGTLEAAYPGAWAFVRGQGEAAIVALACEQDAEGELGVHRAGAVDAGARADASLEDRPSPYLTGVIDASSTVRWETQRGCPYVCSFCQHREAGARLKNRYFLGDRLEQEIALFAEQGVQRISVLDPVFHSDVRRAVAVLQRMKDVGLTALLSLQCRFETVNNAFLDALDGLNVHLEFGLQTAIPEEAALIKRPNKMAKVDEVIGELGRRGISYEVSLIYGLPRQTLQSFRRSVDWCQERRVPTVRAWPLMLLRNTPLFADREDWGYVEEDVDGIPLVVQSHSFSRAEWKEMSVLADALPDRDRAQRTVALGGAK